MLLMEKRLPYTLYKLKRFLELGNGEHPVRQLPIWSCLRQPDATKALQTTAEYKMQTSVESVGALSAVPLQPLVGEESLGYLHTSCNAHMWYIEPLIGVPSSTHGLLFVYSGTRSTHAACVTWSGTTSQATVNTMQTSMWLARHLGQTASPRST